MPLVIGLVTLLMVSSAAVSQLIIRGLQASSRIEAGNRAYLAAEAGIEDALYELTPHFAGYETPPLDDKDVRSANFINSESCDGGSAPWCNEWEVVSISNQTEWSGRMDASRKLMIYLYRDTNLATTGTNAINSGSFDIETIDPGPNFQIIFKIPDGVISSGKLKIDNDQDDTGDGANVNEDPDEPVTQEDIENCPQNPEDNDCDGKVNEDSEEDPVILWKLSDGAEKSLIPLKGCIRKHLNNPSFINEQSELCEHDFIDDTATGYDHSISLPAEAPGINENRSIETISDFISRATNPPDGSPNAKLHFEFLIVAPMEHMQIKIDEAERVEIPYIEYFVKSDSDLLPRPYVQIRSDGYYRGFKQSITSTVTPKTTVPLFDFTIIQQR